jgi:dynein axonemal heavy chain
MTTPPVVWLGGLFNPQAFLTAVMQTAARKPGHETPLDRMTLITEVTKKRNAEDITVAPREGVYVSGVYLEGARWDVNKGVLAESALKELCPEMPVLYLKPAPIEKADTKGTYHCPMYATRQRGPTYIWGFNLRTKAPQSTWTLAGTAMLLSVD